MRKPLEHLSFNFRKTIERNVQVYIVEDSAAKLLELFDESPPDKIFIICDTRIAKLYGRRLRDALAHRYSLHLISHESDEANKNLNSITKISDDFFAHGGTAKSCICALGGGITGNMAGLFATIAFRGIRLIHVPTTFLAQVDSAADVKQSVNSSKTKNSIGAYKAPDTVIIDPNFLKSLDDREIRAGLGESIKHGFAQDMSFVEYIITCDIRDAGAQRYIASRAIQLKIEHWKNTPTMWNDPRKVERLTHLGHTIGKILEMISIDHLSHGEAIAHGMVVEACMSNLLGYLDKDSVTKMHRILSKLELLYPLDKTYTPQRIVRDLYNGGNDPVFALLQGLGNPGTISTTVDKKVTLEALDWYFGQLLT